MLTGFIAPYLDLCLFAEGGFLKGKRDIGTSISAALYPGASAAAANIDAKEVAEDVAENIADVSKVGRIKTAATVHGRMAILVIACALV